MKIPGLCLGILVLGEPGCVACSGSLDGFGSGSVIPM